MSIIDILKNIELKTETIHKHYSDIETLKNEIKKLKKNLFDTCEHVWIKDWEEPTDSRCKWKCETCNLSRNPNYN
jgi:hypothetical protein